MTILSDSISPANADVTEWDNPIIAQGSLPNQVALEMQASAIDLELAHLNVCWLEGDSPVEYLTENAIAQLGDGKKVPQSGQYVTSEVGKILRQYSHCKAGGWWFSGLDPLHDWESMQWGCFKPVSPRSNKQGKAIKYEHPLKSATRAFFPRVSLEVFSKIAGGELPDGYDANEFWLWVQETNQPIWITEGAKKAMSLLSNGKIAIGLPGIFNGHRKLEPGKRELIRDLAWIAGHEVVIAFDNDSKPSSKNNTAIACSQLGRLLAKNKNKVSVASWGGIYTHKGIDDLIAALGEEVLGKLLLVPLTKNHPDFDKLRTPNQTIEKRYLPSNLASISNRLLAIKSPKGTGKTELFSHLSSRLLVDDWMIIVVSHRVQLASALGKRLGISYIDDLDGCNHNGFSIVIDSLHPEGKLKTDIREDDRFTDRKYIVILDECEQLIWHLLNSNTDVKAHRPEILQQFEALLGNADMVAIADADLSDISLSYIEKMVFGDAEKDSFLIVNDWKDGAYECKVYDDSNPSKLLEDMVSLAENHKLVVATDSQKTRAKTGTKVLESLLKETYPDKKILRIDSESIADPDHPAFGIIAKDINRIILDYDILIFSPSMGTGVSLDVKGHFDYCVGFFRGVQHSGSCRQMLSRLREPIPRLVWVAGRGLQYIGDGSCFPSLFLKSQSKQLESQIKILASAGLQLDGGEIESSPHHLRCFASMACRVNSDRNAYRDNLIQGLEGEGVTVTRSEEEGNKFLKEIVTPLAETLTEIENNDIADSDISDLILNPKRGDALLNTREKRKEDRDRSAKFLLHKLYGDVAITPDFVQITSQPGYRQKATLHYYLDKLDRSITRDKEKLDTYLERHDTSFTPDINSSLLSAKVRVLQALRLPEIIAHSGFHQFSDIVLEVNAIAKRYSEDLKPFIGCYNPDNPMGIIRKIVSMIGGKLIRRNRIRHGDKQIWTYYVCFDGAKIREAIFESWDEMLAPSPAPAPAPAPEFKAGGKVNHKNLGGIWEIVEVWRDEIGDWIACQMDGMLEAFRENELIFVS